MAQEDKPQKKQSMIKQIIQIFKFTYAEDKTMPWLVAGAFIAPIILGIIIGIALHWTWLSWIFLMITAIMLGALLGTMVLTNRADKVGYRRLEGQPGAAVSVISNIKGAGFSFPEQPIWFDPRTKDAIWRGTGYNGIYLLGEGDYGRINRAMDRQERSIRGVTAGSSIPVYRLIVGNGEKQVKLSKLRRTILRCKSYTPSNHKFAWMNKIHPRRRFMLTKEELETLNDRLRTLQMKQGMGIPKGIDPTRPQRVSRRAMRGK